MLGANFHVFLISMFCYPDGNTRRSDDTHDWGRANRKRSRQASQGESALTMRKPCSSQPNREATRACNAHPSPRPKARSEPPGPGWNYKYVKEKNRYSYYWISPTRCIVFRRHKQACEFEELRSKYGSDEVRAWEEYRKMKFGQDTWVVSACLYDGGGA